MVRPSMCSLSGTPVVAVHLISDRVPGGRVAEWHRLVELGQHLVRRGKEPFGLDLLQDAADVVRTRARLGAQAL